MPVYTYEYKIFRPRHKTIHSMLVLTCDSYRQGLEKAQEQLHEEYKNTSKGLNVIIKINYLKLFFC